MIYFPVGKSATSPGKLLQWFNYSQCWETSFYFKAEFVWLQFLPIGSYFNEAYSWLALPCGSTCEYQLSCPFVLFRHIKFLMSVSAGIVLQALIFFPLSFKLISVSSDSSLFSESSLFGLDAVLRTSQAYIQSWGRSHAVWLFSHARMASAWQRSLLSSLNPYFLSCKHNVAFLVPKSTTLHYILQQ